MAGDVLSPQEATPQERGHKWFAAFYDRMATSAEKSYLGPVRKEIAGGAQGRVLEIGCGPGGNFSHYTDAATEVVAIEPDPYMLERARKRAAAVERPIDIRQASAEALPFEDGSFDTVVSTLNMCSIPHPDRALAEVRRVLKPGGEYRFYDHVRYDNGFGAFWQDLITPVWKWLGGGCHPNRDVVRIMEDAGFDIVEQERSNPLPAIPPMIITRPHVKGVARPA